MHEVMVRRRLQATEDSYVCLISVALDVSRLRRLSRLEDRLRPGRLIVGISVLRQGGAVAGDTAYGSPESSPEPH